jgi:YkoY family integral membrane protein
LDIASSDLAIVGFLVVLEGLLSADNALVMAIMVLGLPRTQHKQALRYGLIGGFAFRIIATLAAVYLIKLAWIKLLGGLYLLYLTYGHFTGHEEGEDRRTPPKAKPWMGLSAFWGTVVKVEMINLAFSIDSIIVAVGMSPKTWVAGQLITLVQRYPALVDGAFVIIAWVGIKLVLDYLHALNLIAFEISHEVSIALIVVIFIVAFIYAKMQGPRSPSDPLTEKAEDILEGRDD